MDRHWLITWTTYGTWLPGDRRGFVSPVREFDGSQVLHNIPETPLDRDQPGLQEFSTTLLKSPPVHLAADQASKVLEQIQSTAAHREWRLLAVAVMATHVHFVVSVLGDPEPETLLRDFKAYASRALNDGNPSSRGKRWWTASGSTRKLPNEAAVQAAVRYVEQQERPLALWIDPDYARPNERPASTTSDQRRNGERPA